ncbi:hypothetical protein [Kiloniella laminariae]|nr:hypothetical protein [Kiloniella laminariae]
MTGLLAIGTDPAGRMIVATARKFAIPLITAESKILGYEHVATIW